jgi:hypothetical protein
MVTSLVSKNQVLVQPLVENRLIELKKVSKAYNVAAGKFLALRVCCGGWQIGEREVHAYQHDHGN